MNITTIYQEMESRNNLNLAVYLGYLQEHVNSPSFSLSEILNKDSKYMRALGCAALPITKHQAFLTLITKDSHMPVFTSHMALIKLSSELLNHKNSISDLEKLMNSVIDGVRQCRFDDPGTTLSFAFGFVLGTAIKRGIVVKPFFSKMDSSFIVDNDKLFYGFSAGLNLENTCLILNNQYLNDLTERYDNWEDRSRIISLSIFKVIPTEKSSSVPLQEENLKVLEYFSGRSSNYNNFLKEYQNKLHATLLKNKTESAKKNVVEVAKKDSIDKEPLDLVTAITNQMNIHNTIKKQEEQIATLQHQVNLYQSIFQQFEVLFPDLQKTLQSSDSDLLEKIQQLVLTQQGNIQNLESYYEEGERQKNLKEGIKKLL